MGVDAGGLIFYLVYEFERLRLLPGSRPFHLKQLFEFKPNKTLHGRASLRTNSSGSGTPQPRPCIVSFNTFATDKGRSKSLPVPNGTKIRRFGMFAPPGQ